MSCFMKIRKSITLLGAACIVIASLLGLQKGLALLFFCMGFRESLRAKGYYDNAQKKMGYCLFRRWNLCMHLWISLFDELDLNLCISLHSDKQQKKDQPPVSFGNGRLS